MARVTVWTIAGLLLAAGCTTSGGTSTTEDASIPDATAPSADSGVTVADAGAADAAPPPPDAGLDAGRPDAATVDAGTVDAGTADAGRPDAAVMDAATTPDEPVYPAQARHSPITPSVVARLREIAAVQTRAAHVLAKVGDSNTVNTGFLTCLDGTAVDLDGRNALEDTRAWFASGDAAGTSPYDRVSLAATVGWSAPSAVAGNPSPLDQEVTAISPRFAVVMFGTNDIQSRAINTYANAMMTIVDTLAAGGVIPLLTTVPPRDDDATADQWVPRYNLVVRAIAQSRRVPLMDLETAMRALPGHGLGPDGLHLNAYQSGGSRPCNFTAAGLAFGHNTRNLLTLEALDRARAAVDTGVAPDAPAAPRVGTGTQQDPFVLPGLPYVDAQDTRVRGTNVVGTYSCSPANEGGPELYYSLTVTQAVTVEFRVMDGAGTDVDLQLRTPGGTPEQCVDRHDALITATLQPGTHVFTVDTYISGGVAQAGPYLLTVMESP